MELYSVLGGIAMKIRKDFVTNSSSSSYTISTTKTIPNDLNVGNEVYVDRITKNNLEALVDVFGEYDEEFDNNFWNTLKRIGNFNGEQIGLIRRLNSFGDSDDCEVYLKVLDILNQEDSEQNVYVIKVDRDEFYNIDELRDIVLSQSNILYSNDA